LFVVLTPEPTRGGLAGVGGKEKIQAKQGPPREETNQATRDSRITVASAARMLPGVSTNSGGFLSSNLHLAIALL